jgi:hypothetical protein
MPLIVKSSGLLIDAQPLFKKRAKSNMIITTIIVNNDFAKITRILKIVTKTL